MVGIRLSRLTQRFGDTVAVDAVDLEVRRGELLCLLGPSGCGKTTLMRMVAGLLEPTAGTVWFDDRDVTRLPTGARNTAMVFQNYALWPHMTVRQNVAFGLEAKGVARDERRRRVEGALRLVRLAELGDRRPSQLSGGQQQRVALARALVVRPDVLLMDEPLSNLDARLRAEMRDEIRRIRVASPVTTIHVTHDRDEALSLADRVAVMRDGRIVQLGEPMEVYAHPRSRFVADFLGKVNLIPATVVSRTEDGLLLDSALGPLRAATGDESSGQVTCCIRPESIRIGPGATGDNNLSARLRQTTYLGHLAEHTVETNGGPALLVEELKPVARLSPGTHVRLAFDAADLVVLDD